MFSAYAKIADQRYREIFGLDFEEFEVGQVFHHRPGLTITQADNVEEALDTFNAAMLHYDGHYASKTEFGDPLMVSTLTLQKIFGMSWKTFARKDRIIAFDDIAMTAPVFGGMTLYAKSEILRLEAGDETCGIVHVETSGTDETGRQITRVRYNIRIHKAGRHPYYGALNCVKGDERFAAYRKCEDGSWMEQTGIGFDAFEIGEVFEHRPSKTVLPNEAMRHAMQSMEWNPLHTDPTYAKEHLGEEHPPISELYAIGAFTACTTRTFGRVVANLGWSDYQISRHLYPNERFCVESEILARKDSRSRPDQGILTVKTRVLEDGGDRVEVASFNRVLLVYKSGCGPYEAAGY